MATVKKTMEAALLEDFYRNQTIQLTHANFSLHHMKMELEKTKKENDELKKQLELMRLTSQLQGDVAKMRDNEEEDSQQCLGIVALLKRLEEGQQLLEKNLPGDDDVLKKLFPQ